MARRAALLCERGGTHEKLMAVQAGSSASRTALIVIIYSLNRHVRTRGVNSEV